MVDPVEHRLKRCNQLRGRDSTIPGKTVSVWRCRRRIEPTSLDQNEPALGVEQSRPSRQCGDGIGEGPQEVTGQHDIKAPVGQVRSGGIPNMELDRQSGEARFSSARSIIASERSIPTTSAPDAAKRTDSDPVPQPRSATLTAPGGTQWARRPAHAAIVASREAADH